MRNLAILALSALAASAVAQSPLSTLTGGTNGGNVGGGLYFDITVNTTITITQLDFRTGGATVAGTNAFVDIYLGPSTYLNNVTNAGLWTLVGTTTPATVVAGQQVVSAAVVPAGAAPSVTLAPGTYGIALKSNNHSHGYTNGVTCTSATAPGSCANSLFANAELTLRAGAAQNAFLTGGVFAPRIFNGAIHYTLGGTPITFAQRQPYGNGCYNYFQSIYEFMPSTATGQDMSNTSITFSFDSANNRYSNIAFDAVPTAPVAPVSAPLVGVADDINLTITLEPAAGPQPILFPNIGGIGVAPLSVEMCSNGYLNLLGTNLVGTGNPTVAAWLTGTPRIGNWVDMNPLTAGGMHYDYDAVNQQHLFTWNAVDLAGIAASPNTFQIACFANGDMQFRYGTMSLAGGGGWPTMVGYSPGGTSADPGSVDLTTALPASTHGVDQPPLAVVADVNPVLGTTINLTTSNETGLSLGICFVTVSDLPPFSPAGLDLGVIGAPGCVANVDINQGVGNIISNLGLPGISMVVPFQIPAGPPSIIGQSFYSQSVWLDATQNAGGLITSNAVRLKVGTF